jgi:hypothetical protein
VNEFREGLTRFGEHMRRVEPVTPSWDSIATMKRRGRRRQRLAVVTGAVLAVLGAAYWTRGRRDAEAEASAERADAVLMEQVSANLSRPVPRALGPLMGRMY